MDKIKLKNASGGDARKMAVTITNLEASALPNGNETAKKECVIDKNKFIVCNYIHQDFIYIWFRLIYICLFHKLTVFDINIETVKGPTPPGTGVLK